MIRPECKINNCIKLVTKKGKGKFHTICSHHLYWKNPEKHRAQQRRKYERIKNDPDYKFNHNILYKYRELNLTKESYLKMIKLQKNKCAICLEKDNGLQIDHNHETNEIRGLLCRNCNVGLAMFKEKKDILNKAINYLETM